VVNAGTFKRIDLSPYHKGCDTSIDASCNWLELEDLMVEWFYDSLQLIDNINFTSLLISPGIKGKQLIFDLTLMYASMSADDWIQGWNEKGFQKLVYKQLPKYYQDLTAAEELSINLSLNKSGGNASISEFTISLLSGNTKTDFTSLVLEQGRQLIRDYIMSWFAVNCDMEGDVTITIEESDVPEYSVAWSQEIQIVPKLSKTKANDQF
jgi:hypothetical protein